MLNERHPQSPAALRYSAPPRPPRLLKLLDDFTIIAGVSLNETELEERFVRASGPGGQNVNKVASAVELRYDLRASSLPDWLKEATLKLADRRISKEGVIVLSAMRFRTQERNRQDARERLLVLLRKAAEKPKARLATKPSRAAKERRLTEKKSRSTVKKLRQDKGFDA